MAGRQRSKASRPNKAILGSRVHDFKRSRKNGSAFEFEGLDVRVETAERGRRGRRPSVTRRRIHQRTRITRSLTKSSGEKERERGNIRGRIVQDVVEPALVARFPGRRAETRCVQRLAWRVNDSVRLILQLQLEIAKMNEPVDASEEAASRRSRRAGYRVIRHFFDLHLSLEIQLRVS